MNEVAQPLVRAQGLALVVCLLACNANDSGKSDVDANASLACPSRSGYFPCGSDICSRAIQVCYQDQESISECIWVGATAAVSDVDMVVPFPPECASCPTCGCLRASSLSVATCTDDGAGGLTFSLYSGALGDPCRSDANCVSSLCQNGFCTCLTAGNPEVPLGACCSGYVVLGVCQGTVHHPCEVGSGDCYGGTCASDAGQYGLCACVGIPGFCYADSDCCAGATQCVSDACQ